jgi:anthranilate phosphoribosyltransferase
VRPGLVVHSERTPEDYGLARCTPAQLAGGDARHNAAAIRAVLTGKERGAHRDCLLLGAALALEVAGEVSAPRAGIARAAAAIDSGAAARLLEALAASAAAARAGAPA